MDENKNNNDSSAIEPNSKHESHLANDTLPDYTESEKQMAEYMYVKSYYDTMCMSCRHWNFFTCNAEGGNCNFEPL